MNDQKEFTLSIGELKTLLDLFNHLKRFFNLNGEEILIWMKIQQFILENQDEEKSNPKTEL